jgi:catechol 2,3-dioxygenase-like lactoylglutathione lyase family enzyme
MSLFSDAGAAILGLHHVTAIAKDPQRNLNFYTQVLGLRLVKLTVNFDDPSAYHFYFGDASGKPGTILTFFPWQYVARGQVGVGTTQLTSFAVLPGALGFWEARLQQNSVSFESSETLFGEKCLLFEDPDGMLLELVEDATAKSVGEPWGGIPDECAIHGFHRVTICVDGYEHTASLLTQIMGFEAVGEVESTFRYAAGTYGASTLIDVICLPYGHPARMGAGSVHHVAWRVGEEAQQRTMRQILSQERYNVSPVMDRNYFRSIYFREPGGVLFEIATDPPGFTADESLETLGTRLMLPTQYERQRERIQDILPPLVLPDDAHGE